MTLWIAVRATTVTVAAVLGTVAAIGFGADPTAPDQPTTPGVESTSDVAEPPGTADDFDASTNGVITYGHSDATNGHGMTTTGDP